MSSLFAGDFARAVFARRMKGHARATRRPVNFPLETSHAPVCDNVTENRIVNSIMGEKHAQSTGAKLCIGKGASLAVTFGPTGMITAAIPVDSPGLESAVYGVLL
jgi:hypothetical protein